MSTQELFEKHLARLKKHYTNVIFNGTPTDKVGCMYGETIFISDSCIRIKMTISSDYEMNLRKLFHEFGHAIYKFSLGKEKEEEFALRNRAEWEEENEFAAFYNQLVEIKNVTEKEECDDKALLKKMMEKLLDRKDNDPNPNYRAALKRLCNESIWLECITL